MHGEFDHRRAIVMNPVLSILRAAHCRSTHHFFAVDAIPLVQTEAGKRLTSQLLRHHDRYLRGAKEPDTRFRDFQNHVVHVTDGYWGGAPRVAHRWYDRMQRYLRDDRFGDAAHAAGVLSHYFTDPMQPLHTQQCELEKVLHRPIEWSITKSYNQIYRLWKDDQMRVVFQLSGGPSWLGEAILHGARFANRKYHSLINRYDLERATKDPPAGLTDELRESMAEMFGLSITGLARVLERAAADAEAIRRSPIPTASITVPMLLASIRVPARLWTRHIVYKREQLAIESLADEFNRTGTLVNHLPTEVDIVHRVTGIHQDEKRWQQERSIRLASKATLVDVTSAEVESASTDNEPVILPFQRPEAAVGTPMVADGRLRRRDRLVDAPSIGPKTATRFEAIGIQTVGELLDSNADEVARRLATYWITSDTVTQWKHQSTLMCQIADLKSSDAQLLAGAGFDSAHQVAIANPAAIVQSVSEFAATTSGRRYLRGTAPPTNDQIQLWQQNAIASTRDGRGRKSA